MENGLGVTEAWGLVDQCMTITVVQGAEDKTLKGELGENGAN